MGQLGGGGCGGGSSTLTEGQPFCSAQNPRYEILHPTKSDVFLAQSTQTQMQIIFYRKEWQCFPYVEVFISKTVAGLTESHFLPICKCLQKSAPKSNQITCSTEKHVEV